MFNDLKWLWFKNRINAEYKYEEGKTIPDRLIKIFSLFENKDNFPNGFAHREIEKTLQMYCQKPSFREPIRSLSKDIIEEATTAMMLEVSDPREAMKNIWKAHELTAYTHSNSWYFLSCIDSKTAISPYFPTYQTLTAELRFITSMYEENIFKCSSIRRLADYLVYAKIMVNVLANEDILAIYEETYNEYRNAK